MSKCKHILYRLVVMVLAIVNTPYVAVAIMCPNQHFFENCSLCICTLIMVLFFSGLLAYKFWLLHYKQEKKEPTFFELRAMEKTGENGKADILYDITKMFLRCCLIEVLVFIFCSIIRIFRSY